MVDQQNPHIGPPEPPPPELRPFSGRDFEDIERRKIRRLLHNQERMEWLWTTLRVWLGWAAATATFLYMMGEHLIRGIKAVIFKG